MTALLLAADAPPPPSPASVTADAAAEAYALIDRGLTLLTAEPLDDREMVDDAALAASIQRCQQLETQVVAEKLRRIAALDARDAAPGLGARSTADLLAARLDLTAGEARTVTETATALDELPQTAERLRAGEIGVGQVQAAAKTLGDMGAPPEATVGELDTLVATRAPGRNRSQTRADLDAFAHAHAPTVLADRDAAAHRARRVRRSTDPASGAPRYDVILSLPQAAGLDAALEALSTPTGADDPRSREQRLADALATIARRAVDAGDLPTVAAQAPHVLLITNVDPAAPAEVDGIGAVGDATADEICCEAETTPVTIARTGEVLDVGRSRRDPTKAQRAAVIARDRRCIGCGAAAARCQIHHARWWHRDEGPTDEANLVLVCWNCHHHIHHRGWTITGDHITGFAIDRTGTGPRLPERRPR